MDPEGAMKVAGEISCTGCGAHYRAAAWRGLVLSRRMSPDEVRHHVLGWPEEQCVEVRACQCGHLIATRQPTLVGSRDGRDVKASGETAASRPSS